MIGKGRVLADLMLPSRQQLEFAMSEVFVRFYHLKAGLTRYPVADHPGRALASFGFVGEGQGPHALRVFYLTT